MKRSLLNSLRNIRFLKLTLFLIAGFLFSFVFSNKVSAATNLASNPEFTTNTTGWSAVRSTVVRTDFSSSPNIAPTGGLNNFGIAVTTSSTNGQATQSFATTIGDLYIVSVRAYSPSSNSTVNNARLQVSNASWSFLAGANTVSEDQWETVSVGFRANSVTSIIELRDSTSQAGNVSYFDSVKVYHISLSSNQTYYVDPTKTFNGDGTDTESASADGEIGAFNNFDVINKFTGNLSGTTIALKKGTTISQGIRLSNASNFTITSFGSGAMPIIDGSSPFTHTWTQEGNLWYTEIDSGKAYPRAFIVNGTKLNLSANKADLDSGSNKAWFDSVNFRHYVLLDGNTNPNSATIRANSQDNSSLRTIWITGSSSYTISNIQVQYSHDSNILVTSSGNNVVITDMVSIGAGGWGVGSGYGNDGIDFYGSSSAPPTGVIIKDNISNGSLNNGIEIWGLTDAVISGNTLVGNGGGIEIWGYFTNSTIKNNFINNSTLSSTSTLSPNIGRGIWATSNTQSSPNTGNNGNNNIEYNVISNSYSLGISVEQGTGWNIRNNTIYGLLNNVGTGGGASVLRIIGSGTAANVSNNIIVGNDGISTLAYLGASAGNITLTGNNNIFYSLPNNDGYIYFNGTNYTNNFSDFKTATSQSNNLNLNPLFIDINSANFALQKNSPAINAGTNVSLTSDYAGNPVPSGSVVDIGAYEFQDNTSPTTIASVNTGTYNTNQTITLTCDDGQGTGCDKIYYTIDGSTPTINSAQYISPITIIGGTTVLKFFAKDVVGNIESIKTETYAINYPAPPVWLLQQIKVAPIVNSPVNQSTPVSSSPVITPTPTPPLAITPKKQTLINPVAKLSATKPIIIVKTLKPNDNNTEVKKLQQKLQRLGLFSKNIKPNGNYGPETIRAVKKFQKKNKIRTNGLFGPMTRIALNNIK